MVKFFDVSFFFTKSCFRVMLRVFTGSLSEGFTCSDSTLFGSRLGQVYFVGLKTHLPQHVSIFLKPFPLV